MSLRDQLLQVGLISAKQAKEAERQQQHQERQQNPRRKPDARPSHQGAGQAVRHGAPNSANFVQRGAADAGAAAATGAGATVRPSAGPLPSPVPRANPALSAKVARDQDLNRKQQEKAHRKALQDQIRLLIEKNRLASIEGADSYNFVDGSKVRRIGIDAATRARLTRGDVAIVLHAGRYDLVPRDIAERIRERDERAVIGHGVAAQASAGADTAAAEAGYEGFAVPDDLIW